MEKKTQEAGDNLVELKEENEEKKENIKPSQTSQRNLRKSKKVNYSQFFSEDADNSEEYESPEEIKQRIELTKKRQRPKSVKKENTEKKSTKKKKTPKENTDNDKENNNNEAEKKEKNDMEIEEKKNAENNKEKEEENADKKNKNNNFGTIINISDALKQYNNDIPNSELILIILEICLNSSQFGIEKDNSSRAFWDEIGKKDELKQITTKFKTETLRKYWRTIRETKKFRKIISETKKYKNELNKQNMKLYSSIHAICGYVTNPGRKIDYYINKYMAKPASKPKKININDLTPNQQIDDIVNTFMKYFPNKQEKEIIELLFKNNFDIENTFLVLKDAENFESLCFTEKEDEIIKRNNEDKDDKNEEYQNLINSKGLEEVLRRKEFLFNIKIDRSQYVVKDENDKNENANDEKMEVENDDKDKDKEKQKEGGDDKETNKEGNKNEKGNEKENNEKIEIKG